MDFMDFTDSSQASGLPTRNPLLGGRDFVTPLALVFGVVALIAGDGFIREDAYAEIGYALALLSVLGSVACIGYLFLVFRNLDSGFDISFAQRISDFAFLGTSGRGRDWPLLVTIMFSPFVMLFSGLAGWVELQG